MILVEGNLFCWSIKFKVFIDKIIFNFISSTQKHLINKLDSIFKGYEAQTIKNQKQTKNQQLQNRQYRISNEFVNSIDHSSHLIVLRGKR